MTYEPKGRGATARRVIALADGTRTTRQIADELGLSPPYVTATIRRQGIRDKVIIRPKVETVKSYTRRMQEERDFWKAEAERLAVALAKAGVAG